MHSRPGGSHWMPSTPLQACLLCYNIDNLEDFQNNYNLTDPFCEMWLPEETISIMLQGRLPARVTPAVACKGFAATLAKSLTCFNSSKFNKGGYLNALTSTGTTIGVSSIDPTSISSDWSRSWSIPRVQTFSPGPVPVIIIPGDPSAWVKPLVKHVFLQGGLHAQGDHRVVGGEGILPDGELSIVNITMAPSPTVSGDLGTIMAILRIR